MPTPDKQLSAEQSRQVAETIREEMRAAAFPADAGRAGQAQPSTLEKVLGGSPPVHARHHGAAGAGARRLLAQGQDVAPAAVRANGDVALDGLRRSFAPRGDLARRRLCHGAAVVRRQGGSTPIVPRSPGKPPPSLVFREGERQDAAYAQFGEVAVPNQSGHIYLVTNRHASIA
jgi:hypothetical protein